LREKRRLKVFENRALRRIYGPKRDEVTGIGENYIMKSLMICTAHQILFGSSNTAALVSLVFFTLSSGAQLP